MFCSPSARVRRTTNEEDEPAAGLAAPALKAGAKPPLSQPWSIVKSESVATGVAADQGVSCAWVAYVPQRGGVVRTPRGPPLNRTCRSENGSCGLSSKVVTSRPDCGSATTLPASLTTTPLPSAVK